ncbi:unnamed protein product, partial [Meganyctiphanes norvegica]
VGHVLEIAPVGVYDNLHTIMCQAEDKIFQHDNTVQLADCANNHWTHENWPCDAEFPTDPNDVTRYDCPEEHTSPPVGALQVGDTVMKAGRRVAKLYECEPGKAWLSGSRVRLSTCKPGNE